MTLSRLVARATTPLLCLCLSVSALTTDQELDAMLSSATELDAAGKGKESELVADQIRAAVRGRLAADSASETALTRLDRLEAFGARRTQAARSQLAALRARGARGDTVGIRSAFTAFQERFPGVALPPLSELTRPVAAPAPVSSDSCSRTPRPAACPADSPAAPAPVVRTAPAPLVAKGRCPDGPPQVSFLKPSADRDVPITDSALLLQVRLVAPCPLGEIELHRDSALVRRLQIPAGGRGTFELDDALTVSPEVREVGIVACDTFGTCAQASLHMKKVARIPPWIPWTSGGLVILGLATGILALFRRPPGSTGKESQAARGAPIRTSHPKGTASGEQADIQTCLRKVIADAEINLSRGPRLISRMNTAIPPVEADAAQLELALGSLLKLPLARAGLRGTVLVATGRGPVNMEVVLEDNGPDLEDGAIRILFDSGTPKHRERQGMDKELADAADILARLHGHLAAEPRIDGGLRLRIRLPLPSASGPRAASLLK